MNKTMLITALKGLAFLTSDPALGYRGRAANFLLQALIHVLEKEQPQTLSPVINSVEMLRKANTEPSKDSYNAISDACCKILPPPPEEQETKDA